MVLYGPGPQLPIIFPESGFVKPLHFVGSRYSGLPFCRLIMADHQASLFIPFHPFSILVSRGMERIFEGVFLKAVFAWQDWNGWSRGFARCSELTIEQWFGQLRVQMASAQFTARQYWQAAARRLLRTGKELNRLKPPTRDLQKPLTDVQCLVSDGPSVSFGLFVMLCHDCPFPEES